MRHLFILILALFGAACAGSAGGGTGGASPALKSAAAADPVEAAIPRPLYPAFAAPVTCETTLSDRGRTTTVDCVDPSTSPNETLRIVYKKNVCLRQIPVAATLTTPSTNPRFANRMETSEFTFTIRDMNNCTSYLNTENIEYHCDNAFFDPGSSALEIGVSKLQCFIDQRRRARPYDDIERHCTIREQEIANTKGLSCANDLTRSMGACIADLPGISTPCGEAYERRYPLDEVSDDDDDDDVWDF